MTIDRIYPVYRAGQLAYGEGDGIRGSYKYYVRYIVKGYGPRVYRSILFSDMPIVHFLRSLLGGDVVVGIRDGVNIVPLSIIMDLQSIERLA